MKIIKQYVEKIDEELEGAKDYAEKFVEYRVKGNMTAANSFKEMAIDELRHASVIHEMAVKEIEEISKVYTPPAEMQKVWDESHKKYVERAAWIKQMLAM